jgi:hypothetical protein
VSSNLTRVTLKKKTKKNIRRRINIEDIDIHLAALVAIDKLNLASIDLYENGVKIQLTPKWLKQLRAMYFTNSKVIQCRAFSEKRMWENLRARQKAGAEERKRRKKK